ncbi:MAG: leucine-rich repeat protein [Bacilli bacterium]
MENKENKKKEIKNKIIKVTALLGLFLLVFGISYALFRVVLSGTKKNRITTANFGLKLSSDLEGNEETEGYAIDLINAVPISDEEGLEQEGYTFVVTNTGIIPASYTLTLEDIATNTLNDAYIKYNLEQTDYLKQSDRSYYKAGYYNNKSSIKYDPSIDDFYIGTQKLDTLDNRVLHKTTLLPGEKIKYTLRLWIDYDATTEQAANKYFEGKIKINGIQAQKDYTGKSGDNVEYTLYNDGTLILTGTGEMKGLTTDFESGGFTSTANGGSPFGSILKQYLEEQNVTLPDPQKVADASDWTSPDVSVDYVMMMFSAQIINEPFSYGLSLSFSDENIDKCAVDNSYCDYFMIPPDTFNSIEDYKNFYKAVRDCPIRISRLVIDEGITKTNDYAFYGAGDYMISIPTTLTDWGGASLDFNLGHTLIIPPAITTLKTNFLAATAFRMLNIPETVTTIESEAMTISSVGNSYFELYIPNSVSYVDVNGIECYSKCKITIDNSKEYVSNNWNKNWISQSYDYEVEIKYLR